MSPWIAVIAALAAGTIVQPEPRPVEPAPAAPSAADLLAPWADDLARLDPSRPGAYFELGERIADRAEHPIHFDTARTLFVLAFELDRGARQSQGWAVSACLALADMETLARDREWLLALARAMDRSGTTAAAASEDRPPLQTAFLAATALGLARSGEGDQARRLLARDDVRGLLKSYERLLSPLGYAGGLSVLEAQLRHWPCRECGNQRIVRRALGGQVTSRLCGTCGGNPGPALTPEQRAAHLRFESHLLRGIHRSWSAQIVADTGVPLRDPDPEELAPTYRVDPTRPYWRHGTWTDKP
jgi:hypothetical protein